MAREYLRWPSLSELFHIQTLFEYIQVVNVIIYLKVKNLHY